MDYALKLILKQINQKLVCRVDGKEYCYEKGDAAIAELEKNLSDTSTLLKMQEAARTRYIIGFIRRVVQFKCEDASAKDLCLNLRDLILVLGRVKLNEKLYNAVKEHINSGKAAN